MVGIKAGALISPAYLEEQRRLHASPRGYGAKGERWKQVVVALIVCHRARSVLDYGCGQGSLGRAMENEARRPDSFRSYDPARPEFSAPPEPADLVVCTDVLEHIEEDKLDAVLDHLKALTSGVLFVVISTRLSGKLLSDGRDAHILVHSAAWWRAVLTTRGWALIDEPDYRPDKQWCGVLKPLNED